LECSHFLACCAFEIHSKPQHRDHYPSHAGRDILSYFGSFLAGKLLHLDVVRFNLSGMLFASISAASTAQLTLGIRRLNSGNWLWITAGTTHKSQTFPPLEPLGASLTLRIGKIAIERKADIASWLCRT
jgi:hypothetical protein